MKTKAYSKPNKKWYWRERRLFKFYGDEHGPFDTREEARDAARAARITAKADADKFVQQMRAQGVG